jgi:hypothetical protein
LYTNTASSSTKKLIELLDVYQLKQLIKKPTRVTAKTRTLIDVIITQMGNTNVTTSGVIHLGIATIVWCILVAKLVPKEKNQKLLKLGNLNILTVEHLKMI